METLTSSIAYFLLLEILVWGSRAVFGPAGDRQAFRYQKHFPAVSAAVCALCAVAFALFERRYLLHLPYHAIAACLLCLFVLLMALFFRDHFFFGLFLAMQLGILFPCVAFLSTNLTEVLGLGTHFLTLFATALTPAVMALCFWWIRHCCRNISFDIPLPGSYCGVMYLFSLVEYYCLIKVDDLLTQNNLLTIVNLLLQLGMLVLYLIVIRFMCSMCASYQTSLKDQATRQQMELMRKNLEENRAMYEQMRDLRHELKNHMFYMDYLLDQKDYEGLHRYFADFYEKEYENYNYWDTSSTLVGTLLNQKKAFAVNKGIEMKINASLPRETGISDVDLCTVLSNLLDNAIENCGGDHPLITVELSIRKEYFSIQISNTVSGNILEKNPGLSTTKKDPEMHGIGLRVVDRIAKKYNGIKNISVENGMFVVKILLERNSE